MREDSFLIRFLRPNNFNIDSTVEMIEKVNTFQLYFKTVIWWDPICHGILLFASNSRMPWICLPFTEAEYCNYIQFCRVCDGEQKMESTQFWTKWWRLREKLFTPLHSIKRTTRVSQRKVTRGVADGSLCYYYIKIFSYSGQSPRGGLAKNDIKWQEGARS